MSAQPAPASASPTPASAQAGHTSPRSLLRATLQTWLEVQAGIRPAGHLDPYVAPASRWQLHLPTSRPAAWWYVTAATCQTHGRTAHAAVALRTNSGTGPAGRALTIQMAQQDGRWVVTDLRDVDRQAANRAMARPPRRALSDWL